MINMDEVKRIAYNKHAFYKRDLLIMIEHQLESKNLFADDRFSNYCYNHGIADDDYSVRRDELEEMRDILKASM